GAWPVLREPGQLLLHLLAARQYQESVGNERSNGGGLVWNSVHVHGAMHARMGAVSGQNRQAQTPRGTAAGVRRGIPDLERDSRTTVRTGHDVAEPDGRLRVFLRDVVLDIAAHELNGDRGGRGDWADQSR